MCINYKPILKEKKENNNPKVYFRSLLIFKLLLDYPMSFYELNLCSFWFYYGSRK